MVYLALESGREYLLIGDAAWLMDGVRLLKGKDAPWITEDQNAVMSQLQWLNGLTRTEPRCQRNSVTPTAGAAGDHPEFILSCVYVVCDDDPFYCIGGQRGPLSPEF